MASLLAAVEKACVKLRRKRVSRQMFEKYRGVVQRGPFKGLKLDGRANISMGPMAGKLFGIYEQEVIRRIEQHAPYGDVVNFGAADGYFSLGLVKAGLARRSLCFEMTREGRDAIQRNAENNGVADKVEIFGKAEKQSVDVLRKANFTADNALVLCDIEGGEFDIFDAGFYQALSGARIIIELHDRIQHGVPDQRARIIDCIPEQFSYQVFQTVPPDWAGVEDIEALSDNDRALAVSEGRKQIGEWLIVQPRDE